MYLNKTSTQAGIYPQLLTEVLTIPSIALSWDEEKMINMYKDYVEPQLNDVGRNINIIFDIISSAFNATMLFNSDVPR